MTFHVLSYLDGIGLDWLGLLRACSPLDGFCIVIKGCSAGEAISMLDGWCV